MSSRRSTVAAVYLALLSLQVVHPVTALEFTTTPVAAGKGPRAIALLDLNRDGRRDLAVANIQGSNISLLLGLGDGSFSVGDSIATVHKAPHAIISADFDEDGVLDLVTANRDSHSVALFLGDGEGGFRAPVFFPTGQGPRWIAVADFDEDEHADLAVTNRDDGNVTILLGDGRGSFTWAGTYASGQGPVPIVAADFDGDGFIDLAVGDDLGDSLFVLAGDGAGGFELSVVLPVGDAPKNIAVGDLNQDGLSDLAVSCLLDGTVTLLYADGEGNFTPHTRPAGGGSFAVVIEDFDNDGRRDLAVADGVNNNVAVLLGDGSGGFTPPRTFATGASPHALLSADFDRDGRMDLATANTGDNTVSILMNMTPDQADVHGLAVIQQLYSDFFPDPILTIVDQPLRMMITTQAREHVNRLEILPFVRTSDIIFPDRITIIEFTPTDAGQYQIVNAGHGFTGDILVFEDESARREFILRQGHQSVSLIHSAKSADIIPPVIRLFEDIPATIYNLSLDAEHWVSIEPWVEAPDVSQTGNVVPRQVTTFEFTPTDAGTYQIQHAVHGFGGTLIVEPFAIATAVEGVATVSRPHQHELLQNWPNPFNAETIIEFVVEGPSDVEIAVFSQAGQRVKLLVQDRLTSGLHRTLWDGRNRQGERLSSGTYFIRLRTGAHVQVKKAVLLK